MCAGPQGLSRAVLGSCWLWWGTSEATVGGEQPDTLLWLPAACVQASSPAGVGSPAGIASQFNPFSTIPHCVAHSHTSRNGKNLTFFLIALGCYFSCGIFRFERPLEGLGQQRKGAGSGHFCHWNGEYPLSGKSLPIKGRQSFLSSPFC